MLFVFDTNTLISAMLKPLSIPAAALHTALTLGRLVFSESTKNEFLDVAKRPKFDTYMEPALRNELVLSLLSKSLLVEVAISVDNSCKDPKDIKFLELAASIPCACLVSGDFHLTALSPFRGMEIITPKEFLTRYRV